MSTRNLLNLYLHITSVVCSMKVFYLCSLLTFACLESPSQNFYPVGEKRWSIGAAKGFIYAHSKDVENTKGSHPWGIQADYSWRKTDSSTYKKFYGFPVQGVTVSYFNFDNNILGNGIVGAYFLEPEIRISKKAGVHFRAALGAIWLSNPYDAQNNPDNNSYSTSISGYVSLAIEAYAQMLPKWQFMFAGSYRHTSNGGFKLPNKGVNWITGEVILCYFPTQKTDIRPILMQYKQQPYEKILRWDAFVFGAIRGIDDTTTIRYGVAGSGIQVAKQTGKTHAFTLATELYYDNGDKQQMKKEGITRSGIKCGAMLGHEFLWGKYIFSQQIGFYLFDVTPYYPSWYHRWGFYRIVHDKWMAGINLKAHKQVANFIDLRLIYTFRKKELQHSAEENPD